jgi:hypothetical protein
MTWMSLHMLSLGTPAQADFCQYRRQSGQANDLLRPEQFNCSAYEHCGLPTQAWTVQANRTGHLSLCRVLQDFSLLWCDAVWLETVTSAIIHTVVWVLGLRSPVGEYKCVGGPAVFMAWTGLSAHRLPWIQVTTYYLTTFHTDHFDTE